MLFVNHSIVLEGLFKVLLQGTIRVADSCSGCGVANSKLNMFNNSVLKCRTEQFTMVNIFLSKGQEVILFIISYSYSYKLVALVTPSINITIEKTAYENEYVNIIWYVARNESDQSD